MSSAAIVMTGPLAKSDAKVALGQRNHEIQTLATDLSAPCARFLLDVQLSARMTDARQNLCRLTRGRATRGSQDRIFSNDRM